MYTQCLMYLYQQLYRVYLFLYVSHIICSCCFRVALAFKPDCCSFFQSAFQSSDDLFQYFRVVVHLLCKVSFLADSAAQHDSGNHDQELNDGNSDTDSANLPHVLLHECFASYDAASREQFAFS